MSEASRYLVVGAGFSGAVVARKLSEAHPCTVDVVESRGHVAGNCHTERDVSTGVMVHCYGPHIFNTDNEEVWDFVNGFVPFQPFVNRVKASIDRGVFSLPVNLHTINQFFGRRMGPAEARAFIGEKGDSSIGEPANFEEQALKFIGRELYEAFFHGYTLKQWGVEPRELPASILKRLPVRFNYDDNYYNKRYQGIPRDGYTAVVEGILDHPAITVELGREFAPGDEAGYDHVFYTGPLDAYFGHRLGRLGYRTVTFERIETDVDDYQGNAVINYPGIDVPFTRIHEHRHFAPWESPRGTVAFREFSKETGEDDVPYYPKRLASDKELLGKYRKLAEESKGVSFLGRLATYRYMDMEKIIGEALEFARDFLAARERGEPPPVFPNTE